MAEEKGKVVLFGKRWSGRATVAKMLVSGELKDCSLEPTDFSSECETYVGRGWTVIDTMGFGEPLGGIVPDEYVTKMAVDFLNEVKGHYSHIIFVVDSDDILVYSEGDELPIPFMWRTFLETFKGGEENFVVLVTYETPGHEVWVGQLDARIKKMFPECKHFLHAVFGNPDPENFPNDGHTVSRTEALQRLEKEMEDMFTATNYLWAEPEISKMGDAEIQETAAKITRHLTSSPAVKPRQWWQRSADDVLVRVESFGLREESAIASSLGWQWSADDGQGQQYEVCSGSSSRSSLGRRRGHVRAQSSTKEALKQKTIQVLQIRDEMQNLGMEVKFFPRQCEYLLQRSMGASKELQDLVGETTEAIWDDDDYYLTPLSKSLDRLNICTRAARGLLQLCGNSEKEQEVALTLSSCPLSSTTNSQVSKFALVIRDLEWSLDAFRFLMHNPEAQRASSESERQSWVSKFLWCESRGRLVYVGDGDDKCIADADGEDNDVVQSSPVAADNDRQAQDQRDLVPAMESHFTTFQNPKKAVSMLPFLGLTKKITIKQPSSSENVSYMAILRNRLHGDASFDGDSCIRTVPGCFRIPGKQEYKAVQLIGEGSYKKVHKCDWLGMNVAIATESQRNGQSDQGGEDSRNVLEAEAGLLARVQHPNVVTFIGYGYDDENQRGFQVSELMESSLWFLINKDAHSNIFASFCPFSISDSIDILLQIVEAMIHVHECGVIYRDLKAENCLTNIKYNGLDLDVTVVKLTDFGESELQSSEMGCYFKTPNKGSRRWMAPELYQWPGEAVKPYTWSADVYSFGMTCYEVVTGEVPFRVSLFSRRLGEAVRNGLRPPIPGNCPDELRKLMTKCWAHSPEDRPTFKEIRKILWRCKSYYTIFHLDLPNGKFSEPAIKRKKRFCF